MEPWVWSLCLGALMHRALSTGSPACSDNSACGWNSVCYQGTCRCLSGYNMAVNNFDCIENSCSIEDCIECSGPKKCRRCVDYIESNTGRCLKSCLSRYSLIVEGTQVGRVCQESSGGINMTYVAIIVGIGAGILLTILLSVIVYCKMKTDKEKHLRLKLMDQVGGKGKKGRIEKEPAQLADNFSHASNEIGEDEHLKRQHFLHQVSALRPYTNTLMTMVTEAGTRHDQLKAQSSLSSDRKIFIYRNILSQLNRVLHLINTLDPPMPPDGILLIEWAQKIMQEFLRTRNIRPPSSHGSPSASGTLNSLPKQEYMPNGAAPCDTSSPSCAGRFKHERWPSQTEREVAEISLPVAGNHFTEPVVV